MGTNEPYNLSALKFVFLAIQKKLKRLWVEDAYMYVMCVPFLY
jgi:hypothetical protein